MGLSFLFCCGSDAQDNSDDKYPSAPPKRVSAAQQNSNHKTATKPANGSATTADKMQKSPASPAKNTSSADEPSVNEGTTITTAEDTAALDSSEQAANSSAKPAVESNDSDTAVPADFAEQTEAADDDSIFDLTKIQEGQSFNPETGFLLGHKDTKRFGNKKCLILDLDETLVHSSFKYLRSADFVIPVEIDDQVHHVYVIKRPGVDEFLKKVGQWYEVVVFTASVAKYGDPLLNKLDIHQAVHHRLFRDSCYTYQGNFIKNLSQIGRPLQESIIIDNSPASYIFHPQHSIPISSWFSDTHDNELLDLLPLLEDLSKTNVDDVSLVLDITI